MVVPDGFDRFDKSFWHERLRLGSSGKYVRNLNCFRLTGLDLPVRKVSWIIKQFIK